MGEPFEITGGDRPKRPESTDTKGGDAYTITFEVSEVIKTYIDGKLQVEAKIRLIKTVVPVLAEGIRRYYMIMLRSMVLE